jgi:hypothetical protein
MDPVRKLCGTPRERLPDRPSATEFQAAMRAVDLPAFLKDITNEK